MVILRRTLRECTQAVVRFREAVHWPHAAGCEAEVEYDRLEVLHTLYWAEFYLIHGSTEARRMRNRVAARAAQSQVR